MASKTRFRNRKRFDLFLCEIDGMHESDIKAIMGDDYIDTPGFYKDEKKFYSGIENFMLMNMGSSEFNRLRKYWETKVKD
jgi:hypothetical protein